MKCYRYDKNCVDLFGLHRFSMRSVRRCRISDTKAAALAAKNGSAEAVPAGIGCESRTVLLGKPGQCLAHIDAAAAVGVVHRAAADQREAGREDHRAVEDLFVGDEG